METNATIKLTTPTATEHTIIIFMDLVLSNIELKFSLLVLNKQTKGVNQWNTQFRQHMAI